MSDATGVAEVMLGLPGFVVLDAEQRGVELVVEVETIATLVGCAGCGVVATAHDRMAVCYRDLPAFGRPVRLVWRKRRFRCGEALCAVASWTETSDLFASRCVLTRRAALECCIQVGANARPVSHLARDLGVAWHTVMDAVREYGQPLVDDPQRVGPVRALGVDETKWLAATRTTRTAYTTGLVDLDRRVVIDVVEGNAAADLAGWLDQQPGPWLDAVRVVATDLASAYRAGLDGRLRYALRVADPFHVVRIANRCLDAVRRRVQNQTTGHRGRKHDALYKIRKLLVKGAERLDGAGLDRMLLELRIGDPDGDVTGAWCAKESVRDVYLTDSATDAELLLDKTIEWCRLDPVAEIQTLGRTLAKWRAEILNHHLTGASNGPTEALNLLNKKVKRAGHGFTNFANYRLRIPPARRRHRLEPSPTANTPDPERSSPLKCEAPEKVEPTTFSGRKSKTRSGSTIVCCGSSDDPGDCTAGPAPTFVSHAGSFAASQGVRQGSSNSQLVPSASWTAPRMTSQFASQLSVCRETAAN